MTPPALRCRRRSSFSGAVSAIRDRCHGRRAFLGESPCSGKKAAQTVAACRYGASPSCRRRRCMHRYERMPSEVASA